MTPHAAPAAARGVKAPATWVLLLCAIFHPLPPAAEEDSRSLFSADGYRLAELRAPVPQSVPGAITIDTLRASELFNAGDGLFVDVLPAPRRPQGMAPGALWLPLARYNIPGSVWLPNVGYGRLSDELEAYFKANLQRISGGDPDKPLVIYCLADCWMSWNAAKRAAEYGHSRVYWYPDGTNGWEAAGLPLEKSESEPIDRR